MGREDFATTALDRVMAEKMLAAVKKKDVESLAGELAWWRYETLLVMKTRLARAFGLEIVEDDGARTTVSDAPAVDPRQKGLFDDER